MPHAMREPTLNQLWLLTASDDPIEVTCSYLIPFEAKSQTSMGRRASQQSKHAEQLNA